MAVMSSCLHLRFLMLMLMVSSSSMFHLSAASGLSPGFYDQSCPSVFEIVKSGVESAVQKDPRMAASLLRLHFHDCFVNGCDASVLLDDTATMTGEKNAAPNKNSLRGFEVVDAIKAELEAACPSQVSCADILAIATRDAVVQVNGPSWTVRLGRRDSLSANGSLANTALPSPTESLAAIIAKFGALGLSELDVASLSGGHTIGRARCSLIASRLYNFSNSGQADPTMDTSYLHLLQSFCGPSSTASSSSALVNLDVTTADTFDNKYYKNLRASKGLLASDQVLSSTPGAATIAYVNTFAANQKAFFSAFAASMIKMGNISPLTSQDNSQIRTNCHFVNAY